ncbi:hypothetical protein PENTCL1PPCAC_11871, partial [Pristionchus entomophagus]
FQCDGEHDDGKSVIVAGEREYVYSMSILETSCDDKHNLVVKPKYRDHPYYSPPTVASVAFCAKEHDVFGFRSNCVRRMECNGKSCSIVNSETIASEYDVTCTNPKHVFQHIL